MDILVIGFRLTTDHFAGGLWLSSFIQFGFNDCSSSDLYRFDLDAYLE